MKHKIGYLFLLPSYSVYIIFVFIPILLTIYYSFTNYDFYKSHDFIGLKNYIRIFDDPLIMTALKNTAVFSVFVITLQLAFGLVFAAILNNKLFGQTFHRIALYTPNVTSTVSVSMVWLYLYDPAGGLLNYLLNLVGLPPERWLFNPNIALFSIIAMSVWSLIGYNMIVYLAGLQSIPVSLYEAARIDGAGAVQQFLKITVPMLRPVTFFLLIMASIKAFNVFEQVNIMTNGGPMNATTTIMHQIYQKAFLQFEMGYASSMAVLMLVFTFLFTILIFKYGQGYEAES